MRYEALIKNNYTVVVEIDDNDNCSVIDELTKLGGESLFRGFFDLFERYSIDRQNRLTSKQFHLADKETNLYRFRKGNFRVYCYLADDETLVLLTHAVKKKSNETSKSDINEATRVKRRYLQTGVKL